MSNWRGLSVHSELTHQMDQKVYSNDIHLLSMGGSGGGRPAAFRGRSSGIRSPPTILPPKSATAFARVATIAIPQFPSTWAPQSGRSIDSTRSPRSTMQAVVRSTRRPGLLQARPLHQGFVRRAAAQGQDGGEDEADSQAVAQAPTIDPPSPPFPGFAPIAFNTSPNKRYITRLSNAPKYAFKSDLLAYFEGCYLQPHQLVTIYDEKYRQRFIQVEFDDLETFRQGQRAIVRQGRLGGRHMKLDMQSRRFDDDSIHDVVKDFRGQSLLMMQVPKEASQEDVERFFEGYNLLSTRFLRVEKDVPVYVGKKASTDVRANTERRALVRFSSSLEASCALRAKHGQFCLNKSIDLRFVQ